MTAQALPAADNNLLKAMFPEDDGSALPVEAAAHLQGLAFKYSASKPARPYQCVRGEDVVTGGWQPTGMAQKWRSWCLWAAHVSHGQLVLTSGLNRPWYKTHAPAALLRGDNWGRAKAMCGKGVGLLPRAAVCHVEQSQCARGVPVAACCNAHVEQLRRAGVVRLLLQAVVCLLRDSTVVAETEGSARSPVHHLCWSPVHTLVGGTIMARHHHGTAPSWHGTIMARSSSARAFCFWRFEQGLAGPGGILPAQIRANFATPVAVGIWHLCA